MSIKIKKGEYYGDVDELVEFFEKTNIDVPSLFNAPRAYKTHPALIWVSIILYFIGLLLGYYSTNDLKVLMNILCLASLAVCSILCYVKFKSKTLSFIIIISGLIIYLFSTRGITDDDLKNYANRGINKVLTNDSINE